MTHSRIFSLNDASVVGWMVRAREPGAGLRRGVFLRPADPPVLGAADPETKLNGYRPPRDKLRRLVKQALLDIYGLSGPPAWVKRAAVRDDVNQHLIARQLWPHPVSDATIKRARDELARL
jgi:hypothetical protein